MKLIYPNLELILLVALLLAAIFIAIAKLAEFHVKKAKDKSGKTKIYACGEDIDPDDLNIATNTFYRTFIKSFKLGKLKKLHQGLLTEYLYWMFAALVVILTIMVLSW